MQIKKLVIFITLVVVEVSSYYIRPRYGSKFRQLRRHKNPRKSLRNIKETGIRRLISPRKRVILIPENTVTQFKTNSSIKRKSNTSRRRNISNGTRRRTNEAVSVGPFRQQSVSRSIIEPIDAIIEKESKTGICDFFDNPSKQEIRIEGDIRMTYSDYLSTYGLSATRRDKRAATTNFNRRWPNNIIPYSVDGSFNRSQQAEINEAIREWMEFTCIRFRRARNADRDSVRFVLSSNQCSSHVGRIGGEQFIRLSGKCAQKHVVLHEIGHVIGFFHEQSRPDRDGYVIIDFSNIPRELQFNFNKLSQSAANNLGVGYDYFSILHYGDKAFAIDGRRNTIIARDQRFQSDMGRATRLSFRDVKQANVLLNCANHCGFRPCPGEGFLDENCRCMCPGFSAPAAVCGTAGSADSVANIPLPDTSQVENIRTVDNFQGVINQNVNENQDIPLVERAFNR